MTAEIVKFPAPAEMTLDEIFKELGLDDQLHGPDSIFLNPGETIHDRLPHYLARGRAAEAQRRRKGLRVVAGMGTPEE